MLFNFQGPCTFNNFFHLFLKCVIYFTTLESVCQDFFQTFSKSFLSFLWICNLEINLCFTHFLLFSWLKNRLNTGFFKPLLFKFFTALSRQLHYITTLCEECQHFFWIFFVFLTIFYFHSSLPIYRIFSISFI